MISGVLLAIAVGNRLKLNDQQVKKKENTNRSARRFVRHPLQDEVQLQAVKSNTKPE